MQMHNEKKVNTFICHALQYNWLTYLYEFVILKKRMFNL